MTCWIFVSIFTVLIIEVDHRNVAAGLNFRYSVKDFVTEFTPPIHTSECCAAECLEFVFPIWFTQCGRVWFTLAVPCSNHAVLLKAMAQHVCRETACGLPVRIRLLPATTRNYTKVVIRSIPISDAGGQCETKRLSWTRKRVVAAHYEKDDLLDSWTRSSDISSYHAQFHKGHGSMGAWHGHSMLCVNRPLKSITVLCNEGLDIEDTRGVNESIFRWYIVTCVLWIFLYRK